MNAWMLVNWLTTLSPTSTVAIDDGGLTLVELDEDGKQTGAYMEVGGIPDKRNEANS